MRGLVTGGSVALIPAFNEEERIGQVIAEANQFAGKLIVCDDGSSDRTSTVAQKLGVEVIRHKKNLGYGAALRTLFLRALQTDAEIAITIDADRQHDPKSIPQLMEPIANGRADVTVGSRFLMRSRSMPAMRLVGVLLVTKLTQLVLR